MLLESAQRRLGWPTRETILNPPGEGPRRYVRLAREKLGAGIAGFPDVDGLQIGVLSANAASPNTEAPLGIVCEFSRHVSASTLEELHKLAWNFCRSPMLLIVEPHQIRAWTCCEPPRASPDDGSYNPEVAQVAIDPNDVQLGEQIADSLHWVQLISGEFFRTHEKRFNRSNCADELLLRNLEFVRDELHRSGRLDLDTIHDLLARLIFVQFLFQRKDSSGKPALDKAFLSHLFENRVLSKAYSNLPEVLASHDDTYKLFRLLNSRFNGDLFPGKGETEEQREAEWQVEMERVKQKHLNLLSEFVSGNMAMRQGTRNLWPHYSFDVIPLEFISSIYEEFVGEEAQKTAGAHYTPSHIVDFMLDAVLPWDGDQWDLKVLDPACGSGIFLVKAYQRLIYRWRRANDWQHPDVPLLRQLLEKNLLGVDINPHAVRVASFSLYLAMCDAIDPRHYWKRVVFPRLRGKRIIESDFFNDSIDGFRTYPDKGIYDLVIGNAPWGKNTARPAAKRWMKHHPSWKLTYGSVGPLFLAKGAQLTKPTGHLSMLQPAGLLFNSSIAAARAFRKQLFITHRVEEIVNLSALRFGLFKNAVSPSCIVTLCPTPPDADPLIYKCPKPLVTSEDDFRVIIEPHDIHDVFHLEAASDSLIWTSLMWGARRDLRLLRKLMKRPTVEQLEKKKIVIKRQGLNRGNRQRIDSELQNRRILISEQFPSGTFLTLQARQLPKNDDPWVDADASTDYSAFGNPQLIVKQGWQIDAGRFQAAIVKPEKADEGVLCSKSYVSIKASSEGHCPWLEAACLAYNSRIAVYYLMLSSGRLASYRPEVNVDDLIRVPLPEPQSGMLEGITSLEVLDQRAIQSFHLKRSEKALIDDLINFTLPDFKGDATSPGRKSTRSLASGTESDVMWDYCKELVTVLKSGFGTAKATHIAATVFSERDSLLPVRLVTVCFDWPGRNEIVFETIDSSNLVERLNILNDTFMEGAIPSRGGIFYQRIAKIYSHLNVSGRSIPSVSLIKPDRIRYWTKSAAQRDADQLAADAMLATAEVKRRATAGAGA